MNKEISVGSAKGHYRDLGPPDDPVDAALLAAIVAGPLAVSTPAEVAGRAGVEPDRAVDRLADLDAAGWLAVWDLDDGPVATLSPWAAERLGVRLVECGWGEMARWAKLGDDEPRIPRTARRAIESRDEVLESAIDPEPGPEAAAIAAESPRSSRPTILVGLRLVPWPGPAVEELCPACLGRPLPERAYCLRCDRAPGDDGPDRRRVACPKPRPPSGPSAEELRARRKARRRAKLLAKSNPGNPVMSP